MPFTPYDAGKHGIGRARTLLAATRPAVRLPITARMDIRRLSTVMAVAALDTYMHRLILDRAFSHNIMPGGLARLDLPFELLLAHADAPKAAARSKPHNTRPRVGVKRELRDRLLKDTFQRYEDVSRALAMAGRSGQWPAIGQQMSPPLLPEQIRQRLNEIVMRRNQIVHEGDYRRLERPRDSRRNQMTYGAAMVDIDFMAELVDAIHAVV